MAWLDDRIWCHPKIVTLSDRSFRVFVSAITYSSGMGTRGVLSEAQLKLLGAREKQKKELIFCGLFLEKNGEIFIRDWEQHNGKRDERRAADRERKRLARAKTVHSEVGVSAGQPSDNRTDKAPDKHEDRSALKVVKEVKVVTTTTAPNGSVVAASRDQHAGDVLAAVSEAFTAKGIPISTRHRGILGKQARELIDSGFEFDAVVLACVMALRRGEPQNAHFIAGDLVTAKAGQRLTRREYERALQDEMELGR